MKVLYPGTFDPITFGHVDIIKRACSVFDEVIIGLAINARKSPIFTVDERIDLIGRSIDAKFSVVTYEGLTIDYCRNRKINTIIRGVRNQLDFEYEYPIACANKDLAPGIETVFIMSSPAISYISSSMVKDIVKARGDISKFVPTPVVEALEDRLLYE